MNDKRNPLLFPEKPRTPQSPACPKCKEKDYSGHRVSGMIVFKCRKCGTEFGGGLPREPYRNDEIRPYEPAPAVDFAMDPKEKAVVEIRRPVSPTQSYRTGAPVPSEENDV